MEPDTTPEPKPPVTLADVKRLPLDEQRRILRAERDGLDAEIHRLAVMRATVLGALAMIED